MSTRLHLPRPPVRLVPRPRLIERLSQGLSQPFILVCAPAGFGKTTLLAEWLAEHRLPVAWLSLDAEDNDPLRFLSAVLSALATCDPALGASARAFLSSPQGLSLHAVFVPLINEIATSDLGNLVLVLDDFHLISDPEIHRALGYLVEHCPPNLHLVIASRTDPSFALARLRARGQLCELRAADLQFDAQEARAFLQSGSSQHPLVGNLSGTTSHVAVPSSPVTGVPFPRKIHLESSPGRVKTQLLLFSYTLHNERVIRHVPE